MSDKPTAEEKFRNSLKDVEVIIRKLAPLCRTADEIADMVGLARDNDGQLALLMAVITKPDTR